MDCCWPSKKKKTWVIHGSSLLSHLPSRQLLCCMAAALRFRCSSFETSGSWASFGSGRRSSFLPVVFWVEIKKTFRFSILPRSHHPLLPSVRCGDAFNPFLRFFSAKDAGLPLVCRWLPTAALLRSRELFPQRRASFVPRTNFTQRFPRDLCLLLPGPRHLQELQRAQRFLTPQVCFFWLPPVEWGPSTEFYAAGSRSFFNWCLFWPGLFLRLRQGRVDRLNTRSLDWSYEEKSRVCPKKSIFFVVRSKTARAYGR